MSSVIKDPRQWLNFVPDTLKASALYTALWEQLKDDSELLELVALVESNQPIPITFFTAVNFLVLAEPLAPLASYYPYLHPDEAPPFSEAYRYFRAFVHAHREELRMILPTARLQTNEVTRCANLLPAFSLAYQRGGYQPLHMLEIGCSAGLNLLWHQYQYRYGSIVVGDPTSPVQITCEIQGGSLPPLPEKLPHVANCQGIELCPRDIGDAEDMRWVRAAIWPEEVGRHRLLDAAIAFARQEGVSLHKGDACDLLPKLLATISDDQTAVVWSSFAVNQGPIEVKECIDSQIVEASHRIPIYRVSLEFALEKQAGPRLELSEYQGGRLVKQETLARCAVHGERMTWLFEPGTL